MGELTGGTISTSFQTDNALTVYVFADAQHSAFLAGTSTASLAQTTGTMGSLSVRLPGGGTYYVEITPASGGSPETGLITVDATGIDPAPFLGGLASLILGGILAAVGVRYRAVAKERAAAWVRQLAAAATPSGVGPSAVYPAAPWGVPAYGPRSYVPTSAPIPRTLAVTLGNASAADENVQLLLNSAPAVTVTVPAGKTAQASLHTTVTSPRSATVRVEAVTADGRRAVQDVSVGGPETAAVVLRIG